MGTWFISDAGESQRVADSGTFVGWVSGTELHLSSEEGLALQGPNAVAAPTLQRQVPPLFLGLWLLLPLGRGHLRRRSGSPGGHLSHAIATCRPPAGRLTGLELSAEDAVGPTQGTLAPSHPGEELSVHQATSQLRPPCAGKWGVCGEEGYCRGGGGWPVAMGFQGPEDFQDRGAGCPLSLGWLRGLSGHKSPSASPFILAAVTGVGECHGLSGTSRLVSRALPGRRISGPPCLCLAGAQRLEEVGVGRQCVPVKAPQVFDVLV